MKAYHCNLEFDNGAKVGIVRMIVFADNEFHASRICEDTLCRHHDESILSGSISINEININSGSAFILEKER